jgi:hypothetical protein
MDIKNLYSRTPAISKLKFPDGYTAENDSYKNKLLAEKLLLANNLHSRQTETGILIKQLYNHKPNLPALRNELKQGGLV